MKEIAKELDVMIPNFKNPAKKKDYFETKKEKQNAVVNSSTHSHEVDFDVLGKPGEQEDKLQLIAGKKHKNFIEINKKYGNFCKFFMTILPYKGESTRNGLTFIT